MVDGPIRVLLIEDDDDDFLLARELFRELPRGAYHLDRVADYQSAIDALDECDHDLYLVDYRLGKHTGLELIAEARRRGCESPMIMLTGQQQLEIDLQAMQAGAVDYLVKDGLNPLILERSMRYALQQKRHEEAIRRVNQQLEERVRERTAELDNLNQALRREIAERQRVEDAVREASQRKDEFLATLAHELRNPLATISSATQLLSPVPEEREQVEQLQQVMERQVTQLVRLIEDLLDVSRISRGKLTLRKEHLAIGDVLQTALGAARPLVDASQHRLIVTVPQEPIYLDADRVRLAQIIGNLLVNAAKYTPREGQIDLEVRTEAGEVVIAVADNGVGIPQEMLSRIFELFAQVDSSKTRSYGGLGIGLTLVKTLVEMHGGAVLAESEGPSRGSRFTVRLPLADPPKMSAISDVEAPLSIVPRRVLIVDDNVSAAYLLQRLLERLGQEVRTATSGGEALEIMPSYLPEVVISDIGMPGMSGYEMARQVRMHEDLPQPVMVALTGYGNDSDRREALEAGFDHHLCKPISLRSLAEILASLAGS